MAAGFSSTGEAGWRGGDCRGVTVSELLIVLVLMSILAGVAFNNLADQRHGLSIHSAQDAFFSLHGHARAVAVERGLVTMLVVDSDEDMVAVVADDDGSPDTVRSTAFRDRFGTALTGDWQRLVLCMTPRGFGEPSCNSFEGTAEVEFERGTRTGTVLLHPLGQAERQ